MVCKHDLSAEIMGTVSILSEQGKEIKFQSAVPVQKLGVGMIGFEHLAFNRVAADR